MEKSGTPAKRIRHPLRILRPLFWWLILVLVLFGIRTHQRLMEQTRLDFTVTLQSQPIFDAATTLDGKPATGGQKISLGSHIFVVTHPKGDTFSTNLFIWYGAAATAGAFAIGAPVVVAGGIVIGAAVVIGAYHEQIQDTIYNGVSWIGNGISIVP